MFASYSYQARPAQPIKSRRKVFANAMVAHVWAQQNQDEGRSANGNFYFVDKVIYSYGSHFPIAAFTDVEFNGHRVVLFNDEKRSVTTSGHQRYVSAALNGLPVKIFNVPSVKGYGYDRSADHAANLRHLVDAFGTTAARLAKVHVKNWHTDRDRSTYQDLGPDQIETARVEALGEPVANIRDYCSAFGLTCPDLNIDTKVQAIRDAFERYYSPAKIKARSVLASKRITRDVAAVSKAYAFLEGVLPNEPNLSFVSRDVLQSKYSLERELSKETRRIRNAYRPKDEREVTPDEWLDGKGAATQWGFAPTLVRRKGDTLQTSRGAECPFAHAVIAFMKAQQCRATGTTWHRNGQQIRVGVFSVDSIDAQGNMKAGCHTLLFDDMLRLAVREIPERVNAPFPLPVIVL